MGKKKRKRREAPSLPRCSFCDRTQAEVHQLIAGMGGNICDFCAGLAHGIIAEAARDAREQRIASRQDAEQDAIIELVDDAGLASLLEKHLEAHGELDLPMRAAIRGAVGRLRRK